MGELTSKVRVCFVMSIEAANGSCCARGESFAFGARRWVKICEDHRVCMTHRWKGMDSKFQFRDASPPPKALALHFSGEWRLLEPPKQLYRLAEADDRSDNFAAPTVDRPNPTEASKPAAYLARNRKFESTPLQRRVCEPSVPELTRWAAGTSLSHVRNQRSLQRRSRRA